MAEQCSIWIPIVLLKNLKKKKSLVVILLIYDTWLLGDAFLREVFGTLQAMRTEAAVLRKAPPYLYDYFNIFQLHQKVICSMKSSEARMMNALIDMLNKGSLTNLSHCLTRQRPSHMVLSLHVWYQQDYSKRLAAFYQRYRENHSHKM